MAVLDEAIEQILVRTHIISRNDRGLELPLVASENAWEFPQTQYRSAQLIISGLVDNDSLGATLFSFDVGTFDAFSHRRRGTQHVGALNDLVEQGFEGVL